MRRAGQRVFMAGAILCAGARAAAQQPLKFEGSATTPAITAADLMTRLYAFADDSMMGRAVGTVHNARATAYIEREVRALGLVPGGDNGGYFQNLPLFTFSPDSASRMEVEGIALRFGSDFLPVAQDERRVALDGVPVVFGGSSLDASTWMAEDEMAGKIVVMGVPVTTSSFPPLNRVLRARLARSTAIVIMSLDNISARSRAPLLLTQTLMRSDTARAGPPVVFITRRVAALMFGSVDAMTPRAMGKRVTGTLILHKTQAPARNVVAILPGSDPALRGQYVAVGAHNDHVGYNNRPVDHDSIRAVNSVARPQGGDSPQVDRLTPEQATRVQRITDNLRALRPPRLDSIYNGADDDGSGSVSLLEIAEFFARSADRPRRSLLFVWHGGEEEGMWGSEFFTDHPTVPRDSIVAQLNIDMIGRGGAFDVTGETKSGELLRGGPGYLQLIGSRRLSTELGNLMESVNANGGFRLVFDYGMDAAGHPQNIYCRSDHYEYARYGIPVVFLTTGGHADYHQVTDEPQYIDYQHLTLVSRFIEAALAAIANLDRRVVVDQPKPDSKARCTQ